MGQRSILSNRGRLPKLPLLLLGVSKGEIVGTEILQYIEKMLRDHGTSLLIVETSGSEEIEPAQAFYRKNGFEQEAQIRNFYSAGDNKLVFCKALS
ncbi:MAG: hypothetical protein WBB01_11880 [Phormidesmis sp.]